MILICKLHKVARTTMYDRWLSTSIQM